MSLKKQVEDYMLYYVSCHFEMEDDVVAQALIMLDKCWGMRINKFKLGTVCCSLAYKYHQAEDTSGRILLPGYKNKYGAFKNLAATELAVMKFLNYRLSYLDDEPHD